MFEGYEVVEFMKALKAWDESDKKVFCYHKEKVVEFPQNAEWRSAFKVDGSMILDGIWYTEL